MIKLYYLHSSPSTTFSMIPPYSPNQDVWIPSPLYNMYIHKPDDHKQATNNARLCVQVFVSATPLLKKLYETNKKKNGAQNYQDLNNSSA